MGQILFPPKFFKRQLFLTLRGEFIKRKVVVTGIGVANALASGGRKGLDGRDLEALIGNLFKGRSAAFTPSEDFYNIGNDTAVHLKAIAGFPRDVSLPVNDNSSEQLNNIFNNIGRVLSQKDIRPLDPYVIIGVSAALDAIVDGFGETHQNVLDNYYEDKTRRGAIVGTAVGPITTIDKSLSDYRNKGARGVSPRSIPNIVADKLPVKIADSFAIQGDTFSVNSACASGSTAIGYLFRAIRDGYLDMGVTGGSEFITSGMPSAGFLKGGAISMYDGMPSEASRPFADDRCGFMPAEGAAMLVLERKDYAIARGARIYGEPLGFAMTNDAAGKDTAPTLEGPMLAMINALKDAGLTPEQIDYINAHGTSTWLNDSNEIRAIKGVFGEHAENIYLNSSKSMVGHILGGSGALETAITFIELWKGMLHPTLNLTPDNLDPLCSGVRHVMGEAISADMKYALNNAFGIGGQNAVLVLGRYNA